MDDVSEISLGTCAWNYEDWRGVFYPETLPKTQLLGWYARYFKAVEVDSTFYRSPSPHVTAQWRDATPDDFRFTVKLTREITHQKKLRDCEAPLERFLEGLEPLREKLGCVLIQLPSSFRAAQEDDVLRRFLMRLPRDWRFAIEFRDPGWYLPKVIHWLQDYRVCWAWTDTEPYSHQAEGAFELLPITTDFLYVRLLGDLKTKFLADGTRRVERYDHHFWPRNRSIENWVVKIRHHLQESSAIFLFAANHFEGCSPLTAGKMAKALGIGLELPKLETPGEKPGQLDLF